jgi:hypothetical protein
MEGYKERNCAEITEKEGKRRSGKFLQTVEQTAFPRNRWKSEDDRKQ